VRRAAHGSYGAQNMKKNHKRRPGKLEFHPLAFGGWGDYEVWAEHGFTPKPKSAPAPARPEPGTGGPEATAPGDPAEPGAPAPSAEPGARPAPAKAAPRATPAKAGAPTTPTKPATPAKPGARPAPAKPATRTTPAQRPAPATPSTSATPTAPADPAARPAPARHSAPSRAAADGSAREPLDLREPPRPRPYVRGTRVPQPGPRHPLLPEVMLSTTGRHRTTAGLDPDLAAICRMCQIPTSVAEVAAYLLRPLDVTRALVLRGIDDGLLVARGAQLGVSDRPPLELLHRVHQGLLRLG
jgi:hypothetical protein